MRVFFFSFTGVEDRMSVIWEKGVVSVLAEQCCSTLLWSGLDEISVLSRIFILYQYVCEL